MIQVQWDCIKHTEPVVLVFYFFKKGQLWLALKFWLKFRLKKLLPDTQSITEDGISTHYLRIVGCALFLNYLVFNTSCEKFDQIFKYILPFMMPREKNNWGRSKELYLTNIKNSFSPHKKINSFQVKNVDFGTRFFPWETFRLANYVYLIWKT